MIDIGVLLRGTTWVIGQPSHVRARRRRGVRGVWVDAANVGSVPPPDPGPADHLSAFVDRATAAAGNPSADPDAARLRAAMAGESPARFRDRLVLERAAWWAKETHLRLQDIAVDCGFRGYDVFVRAFRRELGASPSEWRADPTSTAIDAPGDVHFQAPDLLRLPAHSRTGPADSVDMAERHVRLVGGLVDAAGAAPDPAGVPAQLVGDMERFTALVHETSYDVPAGSLRARLDLAGPAYVATVARLGASGRLDEAVVDAFSPDPTVVTFGQMVTAAVMRMSGADRGFS
jgi:hypothetical protein